MLLTLYELETKALEILSPVLSYLLKWQKSIKIHNWMDWTNTVCSVILNTGKKLPFFERFQQFFGNVLPVFYRLNWFVLPSTMSRDIVEWGKNQLCLYITEQTILVQVVYVKEVNRGSLKVSYTLVECTTYKPATGF